jgi:hypothetical protein
MKRNKEITRKFFKDDDGYLKMRKKWKELLDKKEKLQFKDHIRYLMVLGKDYRKAISPITNKNKIDKPNYIYNWVPYNESYKILHKGYYDPFWIHFKDILVDNILEELKFEHNYNITNFMKSVGEKNG